MDRPVTAISRYSNLTVNSVSSQFSIQLLEDIFTVDGISNDVILKNSTIEWQKVKTEIPGDEVLESDIYRIDIYTNVIGLRVRKIKTVTEKEKFR
jgi:hypothetical protein